ncbi:MULTISPECIES: carbohydrate ABC transporter permease [Paenibacillus]|jgi:raffinose/stachyose/melibiose transport system permease protein|uniref:Carbohydrate ABC transporter permease n=1 Tax=Paenibacillus baimaensis TaxID=2982185 RepID=A0ABT2UBM6_9BACL|nr:MULTISPECIES: carbohydrate ABC transporter permease [Paenibacillus]MCU6791337.1 carbohydrate ABC transporter permease [Paenibacillus sp. WQ 127069]OMF18939.1 ABC transporter permease [Paenibacillus sp. FSL H7-0331]
MQTSLGKKTIIHILLAVLSAINILPIVWMVVSSFKSEADFATNPLGLPKTWNFSNYTSAWKVAHLGTYFWNSVLVTAASILLTVLLGALASYFLSRFEFRMRGWLYGLFIIGMTIPIHATLVPIFIVMKKIGLLNTHLSLVLPYTAFHLSITIFILAGFMRGFPKDVEESAIMDGAGLYRIFWSIILPMTRPALATVIIINFIYNWNEFLFALVLINKAALKTLPLGLANFAGTETRFQTLQMAALTMALVPLVGFYLAMEKQLIQGMTAGAVKG